MARKKDSRVEYHRQRMEHLHRLYRISVRECDVVCRSEVYARIVREPAPRFWVSAGRALKVVSGILRGEWPEWMRPAKQRMYVEIVRRVAAEMARDPGLGLRDAVERVVESPAPESYMEPGSAMTMLYGWRRRGRPPDPLKGEGLTRERL